MSSHLRVTPSGSCWKAISGWKRRPRQADPKRALFLPRSWEILSDALHGYGDGVSQRQIEISSFGSLTVEHAVQFNTFVKVLKNKYGIAAVIKGDVGWPKKPEERELLYFLAMSLRDQLLKNLPPFGIACRLIQDCGRPRDLQKPSNFGRRGRGGHEDHLF